MKYFLSEDHLCVIKAPYLHSPWYERWDYRSHEWVEGMSEPGSSWWWKFDEIAEEEAPYWIEQNEQRIAITKPWG